MDLRGTHPPRGWRRRSSTGDFPIHKSSTTLVLVLHFSSASISVGPPVVSAAPQNPLKGVEVLTHQGKSSDTGYSPSIDSPDRKPSFLLFLGPLSIADRGQEIQGSGGKDSVPALILFFWVYVN